MTRTEKTAIDNLKIDNGDGTYILKRYADTILSYIKFSETEITALQEENERLKADAERDYDTYTNVVIKLAEEKQHNATLTKALEQIPEWISVKDRLPENDEDVLTYSPESGFDVYFYDGGMYLPYWKEVTHWMPLPCVPARSAINSKEEEEEEG